MELHLDDLGNVGIIIADWDYNKEFKARTITTDYSSWIAYISRKDVPAGIELTDNEYWKPLMRVPQDVAIDYNEFKDEILSKFGNLEVIVDSFLKTSGSGVALDNKLGNNDFIGINQKTITEVINAIWNKINDITGEDLKGIEMSVDPTYFVSEDGCNVHITATSADATGKFEHIAFYANDELIAETDDVESFEYNTTINDTTTIKCVAMMLGREYTKEETITHYASFWVGGGLNATDIMIPENLIQVNDPLRTTRDITLNESDRIFVVLDKSLHNLFIRLDMNGFEIPLNESEETYEGKTYKVLKSVNQYRTGTYNIDING